MQHVVNMVVKESKDYFRLDSQINMSKLATWAIQVLATILASHIEITSYNTAWQVTLLSWYFYNEMIAQPIKILAASIKFELTTARDEFSRGL